MALKNRQSSTTTKKTYIALPRQWPVEQKAEAEALLGQIARILNQRHAGRTRRAQLAVSTNEDGDVVLRFASLSEQATRTRFGMPNPGLDLRKRQAGTAALKAGSVRIMPPVKPAAADDPLATALAEARQRGAETVATILAGEDMLNSVDFAKLLGLSVTAVHDKMKRHEVLGLEGAKRGVKFPRWQIGRNGRLPTELPLLFEQLGNEPWSVYRFLVQRHPELDGARGHEALREGRGAALLDLVADVVAGAFS